jgi:hypothetical protein
VECEISKLSGCSRMQFEKKNLYKSMSFYFFIVL